MKILLDCDGVLADFHTKALDEINSFMGSRFTVNDVKSDVDVTKGLMPLSQRHLLDEVIAKEGWCRSIPVLRGAKEGVSELAKLGTIQIVTKPAPTPYWRKERYEWLEEHFGLPKSQVLFMHFKHSVDGDVFIDDNRGNCRLWHELHHSSLTVLWHRPYNRGNTMPGVGLCSNWGHLVQTVRDFKASHK